MAKGTAAAIDACDDVTVQGKWIDALWQMSFSLWVKVEMECFSHMLGGYSQHLQDSEGGDTHTHTLMKKKYWQPQGFHFSYPNQITQPETFTRQMYIHIITQTHTDTLSSWATMPPAG